MKDPRIALYREAMDVEKQRSTVQADLRAVNARLSEIHRQLFATEKARLSNGRAQLGRGELSAKILEQLKLAGEKGVKVRDLAGQIGAKTKNLFIWFATTGKRNKGIEKIGEGHYRLGR